MGRLSIQKEIAVIIQGPIRISPTLLEKAWSGVDIIWSTWEGEAIESTNPILYNPIPNNKGVKNLGMQVDSTMKGLYYSRERGYKYSLKWRSDQMPTNSGALLGLFTSDAINVLYWCNCDGGYYTDYFTFGETEKLIDVWNIQDLSSPMFPELALTERLGVHRVRCIGDFMTYENDIMWHRPRGTIYLHSYKSTGNFEHKDTV
jgi:hypothetical protein